MKEIYSPKSGLLLFIQDLKLDGRIRIFAATSGTSAIKILLYVMPAKAANLS